MKSIQRYNIDLNKDINARCFITRCNYEGSYKEIISWFGLQSVSIFEAYNIFSKDESYEKNLFGENTVSRLHGLYMFLWVKDCNDYDHIKFTL